jgi:hypothetical protein
MSAWAMGAVITLAPAAAAALDVPGIEGHMTDPAQVLGKDDKRSIEDKLGSLQGDTRVDVAGWIVDAPESSLDALGHEAFRKWHIGNDWDNALFFVVPRVGRAHLIQNDAHPELSALEAASLLAADKPGAPMPQRMDALADAAGSIVRAKALRSRPPGVADPGRGLRFALGWSAVLALAVGLTARAERKKRAKKRTQTGADEPPAVETNQGHRP